MGRKRDQVWRHFGEPYNAGNKTQRVDCLHCHKSATACVTNLKQHLKQVCTATHLINASSPLSSSLAGDDDDNNNNVTANDTAEPSSAEMTLSGARQRISRLERRIAQLQRELVEERAERAALQVRVCQDDEIVAEASRATRVMRGLEESIARRKRNNPLLDSSYTSLPSPSRHRLSQKSSSFVAAASTSHIDKHRYAVSSHANGNWVLFRSRNHGKVESIDLYPLDLGEYVELQERPYRIAYHPSILDACFNSPFDETLSMMLPKSSLVASRMVNFCLPTSHQGRLRARQDGLVTALSSFLAAQQVERCSDRVPVRAIEAYFTKKINNDHRRSERASAQGGSSSELWLDDEDDYNREEMLRRGADLAEAHFDASRVLMEEEEEEGGGSSPHHQRVESLTGSAEEVRGDSEEFVEEEMRIRPTRGRGGRYNGGALRFARGRRPAIGTNFHHDDSSEETSRRPMTSKAMEDMFGEMGRRMYGTLASGLRAELLGKRAEEDGERPPPPASKRSRQDGDAAAMINPQADDDDSHSPAGDVAQET